MHGQGCLRLAQIRMICVRVFARLTPPLDAQSRQGPWRVWRWAIIRHGWGFFREEGVHQEAHVC
jgi:hypothetical protein